MAKQHSRSLKIHSSTRDKKQVPELRLVGLWMEQLGFNVGERVSITMRERLLIIEPLEESMEESNLKAALQEVQQALKKIN